MTHTENGDWTARGRGLAPALGLGIALSWAAITPVDAYFYGDPYQRDYWHGPRGYYDPYYPSYRERAAPRRPSTRSRAVKKPNVERPLSAAEKQADADLKAKVQQGPLHIVISIEDQSLGLYSNGELIARSKVSTGVPGHPTPTGVFSIIQKRRFHSSNIYSDAPMPYMQRITWSGIALHQGVVPDRPASHGCIRLPEAFARQLWGISKMGARVIITHQQVTPADFTHARLFVVKAASETPVVSAPPDRPKGQPLRVAEAGSRVTDAPVAGSLESKPVAVSVTQSKSAPGTAATDPAEAGPEPPVQAAPEKVVKKPLRAGPVSVFISRKEGKLFVRKGFQPVFDALVSIERRDAPLGTHVFTAMGLNADGVSMRWTAITVPPSPERHADSTTRAGAKIAQAARKPVEPAVVVSPGEALDRITIPADALERISSLMTPGASLIVSDHGLGYETGLETDFVVVTR